MPVPAVPGTRTTRLSNKDASNWLMQKVKAGRQARNAGSLCTHSAIMPRVFITGSHKAGREADQCLQVPHPQPFLMFCS